MRKAPEAIGLPGEEAMAALADRPGIVREERTYRLITPLFGGGVERQQYDPLTVIRAPGIRGQLRFWWRATRGGAAGGELQALREREAEIWGMSVGLEQLRPSQVQVTVSGADPTKCRAFPIADAESPYGYVGFPLFGANPPGTAYTQISFTLRLSYPAALQADIAAALWAWETFGGVGGRTRRGFGALAPTHLSTSLLPARSGEVKGWLLQHWRQHLNGTDWPADVPNLGLSARLVLVQGEASVELVWQRLIKALKDFRQQRNGKYGRSYWPEPDAIRDLTGQAAAKNRTPLAGSPPIVKFPRAAFGLPIIFEFKNGDPRNRQREPRKTTLTLDSSDRLASPLILRPGVCADGSAYGIALVLAPRLSAERARLKLEAKEGIGQWPEPGQPPLSWDVIEAERRRLTLAGLKLDTRDPLRAFLGALNGMAVLPEGEA